MTRRVRCFIAVSLDGFIADANGGVDWLFADEDYGYSDFIAGVDTLLLGRKTYQQVQAFGAWPYENQRTYVFTSQTFPADSNVVFVTEEAETFIRDLKSKPGGDIWLVGGSSLNTTCLRGGLVDDLILSVHPILLGQGIPLFAPPFDLQRLSLQNSQTYASGLIQLTYRLESPELRSEGPVSEEASLEELLASQEESHSPAPLSNELSATSGATGKAFQAEEEPEEATTPAQDPVAASPTRENLAQVRAERTDDNVSKTNVATPGSPSEPDSNFSVILWGAAAGLGLLLGIAQALASRIIDPPFLFPILLGIGLGVGLGMLAQERPQLPARLVGASAVFGALIVLGTSQFTGAILARPLMANHLAGVINKQPGERDALRSSIESRLTLGATLQLYRQMQSDADWRTQYYGAGSQFKLSGQSYSLLLVLDGLLLLGFGTGTALLFSLAPTEQEKLRAGLRQWLEARKQPDDSTPEEQA